MNKNVLMTSVLGLQLAATIALAVAALAVPTAQANLTPAGKYGQLDPWAYKLVHQSAPSVPLITEHSAGQNGTALPSIRQSVPLITEHSLGQNGVSKSAAASVTATVPNGFDWGDAGIGATIAFTAVLLALAAATLILRRRGSRLAGI